MKHPKVFTLHPIDQPIASQWPNNQPVYHGKSTNGNFIPQYIPPIAYFYPSGDLSPEGRTGVSTSSLREAILRETDYQFDQQFKVKRKSTDVFFLFLVFLFFGFLGYLLFDAIVIEHSNPNLILHGYDNWGNICGQRNKPLSNVPYSGQDMFRKPYLLIYFGTNRTTRRICVEDCNEAIFIKTTFNRCLPRRLGMDQIAQTVNYTRSFIDSFASDVIICFKEIVYLFILSFVLALLLVILLRFMASIIIWFTLIVLTIAVIMGTAHTWLYWNFLTNYSSLVINQTELTVTQTNPENDKLAERWLIYSIGSTIFTILFLLVLLVMRKRIQLVCLLFKEAGKAIGSMPMLLLQPILTLTVLSVLGFFWSIGALYLMSNRSPMVDPSTGFVVYTFEPYYSYVKWINIFALLWAIYFVTACQHYVIAGSVSKWFFQRDKSKLNWPIVRSIFELIRFHLGSIALGSLLVAGMKLIRFLFKKIETLTNRTKDSCGYVNKICSACCWIFEKFLIYLNKNAYIVMAIHGHSFSSSARRAFSILSSNTLKIAAINTVGDFLLFLGKLSVISLTVLIGIEITREKSDKLNYSWSPIVISAIFSYFIAHCFLAVYEMTIDTLFICFCEECNNSEAADEAESNDPRKGQQKRLIRQF